MKIHAAFPGGDPAIQGVLILHDLEIGAPLAILDSNYLTALRTRLAGALGADVLALPDARCLAIIGTAPRPLPIGRFAHGGGDNIGAGLRFIKSRSLGGELRPVLFRSLAQSIGPDPSLIGYSVLAARRGIPLAGECRAP